MKPVCAPLVLLCLATGLFAADTLPRYNLPAGRQLTYTVDDSATGPAAYTAHDAWTLTVLAENADGSRSILADAVMTRENTGEQYGARKGKNENKMTFVFDINARGQLVKGDFLGDYARGILFPLLPAGAQELKAGWTDGDDKAVVKQNAAQFEFELSRFDPVTQAKSTKTVTFDSVKGVIAKAQREHSRDYGMAITGSESMLLTKDTNLDAGALEAARQFLIYAQAQRQYQETLEQINDDPAHCTELLAQAREILASEAKKVTTPEVQKAFERSLTEFQGQSKMYTAQAEKLLPIVNKPVADWSTTDFNGEKWSKEKVRGNVAVFDFWYRGCGWCIKAMPQMKQLADLYKDKPVKILGVNVDQNEDDGKEVIKTMELNYPQLKGRELMAQFGVTSFPMLVIIDQDGVARSVHFGYSVSLRETLSKKIDALLNGKPGK